MLADTAGAADKAALTSFPAPDCAMPQGWPAIAERRPHYVIFGETHGTREAPAFVGRSEEHTSELQSLMRISYAVFCLKKKKKNTQNNNTRHRSYNTL